MAGHGWLVGVWKSFQENELSSFGWTGVENVFRLGAVETDS